MHGCMLFYTTIPTPTDGGKQRGQAQSQPARIQSGSPSHTASVADAVPRMKLQSYPLRHSPFTTPAGVYITPVLHLFLQQAEIAVAAIGHNEAALHDFRVALRRLRSWLKAYGDTLATGDDLRKQVSALASATNRCRDLEVYAQWLEQRRHALDTPPIHAYRREILEQLALATQGAGAEISRNWPDTRNRLVTALASQTTMADELFAQLAYQRLSERMLALKRQMKRIDARKEHAGSARELHKCRIHIKQAHYLIDVFKPWHVDCRSTARKLKSLQDNLGDYHDLCLFTDAATQAAGDHKQMKPLLRAIEKERYDCFRKLHRTYFSPPIKWLQQLEHSIEIILEKVNEEAKLCR